MAQVGGRDETPVGSVRPHRQRERERERETAGPGDGLCGEPAGWSPGAQTVPQVPLVCHNQLAAHPRANSRTVEPEQERDAARASRGAFKLELHVGLSPEVGPLCAGGVKDLK